MKNICIMVSIIAFFYSYSYSQDSYEGIVLLNSRHIQTPMYKKPNGKISLYIINDTIKENYFIIYIKKISGKYAYVEASAVRFDTIPKMGWIELKHLGIYSNNYSKPVLLYSEPNKGSSVSANFPNPGYDMFQVENCKSMWLYVKYKYKGREFKGWLPPESQCANPYTTCN